MFKFSIHPKYFLTIKRKLNSYIIFETVNLFIQREVNNQRIQLPNITISAKKKTPKKEITKPTHIFLPYTNWRKKPHKRNWMIKPLIKNIDKTHEFGGMRNRAVTVVWFDFPMNSLPLLVSSPLIIHRSVLQEKEEETYSSRKRMKKKKLIWIDLDIR